MDLMQVIRLESPSKSFRYNDGLFAISKQDGGLLYLWKIRNGELVNYEDGKPHITVVSSKNKGIVTTNLLMINK